MSAATTHAGAALEGVQVVVTRPEDADGGLSALLVERGAEVLHWPVIRFEPPVDPAPLERALERLASYDWIVFSSPRAVAAVAERVPPPRGWPRIAAVGAATARALAARGFRTDVLPSDAGGEGLVAELGRRDLAGSKVLFPASEIARRDLPDGLAGLGASVDRVVAYRTVEAHLDVDRCLAAIDAAGRPMVTFASPSAVRGLERSLGSRAFERVLSSCPAVVIGPTTAAALERRGVTARAVAEPTTLEGLASALERVAAEAREEV